MKIKWWQKLYREWGYCNQCKEDVYIIDGEKIGIEFPYSAIGISTNNIPLSLVSENEYEKLCCKCKTKIALHQ